MGAGERAGAGGEGGAGEGGAGGEGGAAAGAGAGKQEEQEQDEKEEDGHKHLCLKVHINFYCSLLSEHQYYAIYLEFSRTNEINWNCFIHLIIINIIRNLRNVPQVYFAR